ncbi:hypothetical protein SD70_13245 [Gordoniibacillus kamchatkensis]|uniref:Solute-binding protein family 5 domain-containing protein n=1 Tax=Gordoniibacillus kamchatkensis TaxID=1590651 RepID=A0ABR5AHT9_9BACL|nr:peptide ABC transporter substrate-binding protein [Paenibacillus sp. VKM B-2647]KIL40520.1 hypothetical protein SD70_13245 [Paenibacillus sp. VKM B-2647]
MRIGKTTRTAALLLSLALSLSALAGCSGGSTGTGNTAASGNNAATSSPKPSGPPTFINLSGIINPESVTNFNPLLPTGNLTATYPDFFDYVFNHLFYFNAVKGEIQPDLALESSWLDNDLTFKVKLNTKAKWHDGQPFTADDVVYTFNVLRDNKALDLTNLWGEKRLKEVVAEGKDTVIFKLGAKFPSLPYYLSAPNTYIMPKHIFEKENAAAFQNKNPVGTGLYKFKSINESAIILEKNPDFFAGAANIDQLIINRFNNTASLSLAIEKGDIDLAAQISSASLPKVLENPVSKMQLYPAPLSYNLVMNNEKPGLNDVAVRRAIQLAIDRKTLKESTEFNGVFIPNPGYLSIVFGDLVNKSLPDNPEYQFNLKAAEKYLTDAGYTKNAKGIYEKGGKPLSFTYYMTANSATQNKQGAMITANLKEIGIETTIKTATVPELTKLMMSGDYDIVQLVINAPSDPQAQLEIFHSKATAPSGTPTPGLNYMRFRDAEVDKWLDEAASADANTRKQLYQKVQKKIADLAPLAVMYTVGGKAIYRTDRLTDLNEQVPLTSAIAIRTMKKK